MFTQKELNFIAEKLQNAVKDLLNKSVDNTEEEVKEEQADVNKATDNQPKEEVNKAAETKEPEAKKEDTIEKDVTKEKEEKPVVEINEEGIIKKAVDTAKETIVSELTNELSELLVKSVSESISEIKKYFESEIKKLNDRIATIEQAPTVRKSIDNKASESPKEEKDIQKDIEKIDVLIEKAIAVAPQKVLTLDSDIAIWENTHKLTPALEAVLKSLDLE